MNSDNLHLSNAGRQRFTTVFTAAVSWLLSPASPSCGQLIDTDIASVPLSVSASQFQAWLYPQRGTFCNENLEEPELQSRESGCGPAIQVLASRHSVMTHDWKIHDECCSLIQPGTRGLNRSTVKLD